MQTRTRSPFLTLNALHLVLVLGGSAGACIAIQLALGAALVPLFSTVMVCLLGLTAFWLIGAYIAGAWVVLFYAIGNVIVALYAKTALGQPLQSHLSVPNQSFLMVLGGTAAMVAALALTRAVRVGRPLLPPTSDPGKLRWLSSCSFLLGATFWFLNEHFHGQNGNGFGGFALFQELLLMAVIARTAMLLEASGGRRQLDLLLILIMLVTVTLGLTQFKKTAVALPVVSYFATLLFYQRGLSGRQLAMIFGGALVFVTILTPLIQACRYLGQLETEGTHRELSVQQRTSLLTGTMSVLSSSGGFARVHSLARIEFRHGYYNYFGDQGKGQMVLGRYAAIQQIDPVVSMVDSHGVIGLPVISRSLARVLPSIIYPGKPRYSESFHILIALGLINPKDSKFPTLPLIGQAYAAFGTLGVAVIPFVVFLLFFLAFKKVGWEMYRNTYGIFFFCEFVIVYANQGDIFQYVSEIFRHFPIFVLIFWLIRVIGQITVRIPNNQRHVFSSKTLRVITKDQIGPI